MKIYFSVLVTCVITMVCSCGKNEVSKKVTPHDVKMATRSEVDGIVRDIGIVGVVLAMKDENKQMIVVKTAGDHQVVSQFENDVSQMDLRLYTEDDSIQGMIIFGSTLRFDSRSSDAKVYYLPIYNGVFSIEVGEAEIAVYPNDLIQSVKRGGGP